MIARVNIKRKAVPGPAMIALLVGLSSISPAQAVTVFSENFEGYNSFPTYDPAFDPVNPGIAKLSEGAAETWYAARFESTGSTVASIDADLAVQQFGGFFSSNNSHTGRVADDAGMLFKISTTGYSSVNLSFDWRTFQAETTDRIVVGYHNGPISEFGFCDGNGSTGCYADLRTGSNSWTSGWTELLRASASTSWNSQNYALTPGQSQVWVAFWMDNGNGDYAKFDNVRVTATPVPETDSWAMMVAGLGLIGFCVSRRKQN